jgi:hypothetical protein
MPGRGSVDGLLASARGGWQWFRTRSLALQIAAWAVVAVVVAVVGLTLEQSPPTQNAFTGIPDNGPGAGSAAAATGTVTNAGGPGLEGADAQLPRGAIPNEVGRVSVSHFRATTQSVTQLFNEVLGGRGRAGLNANQLLHASCSHGSCTIDYIPDGPGAGRIIESQGPIWEVLAKDPTWRVATITASTGGPDIVGRGKGGGPPAGHGPPAVFLRCTRAAVLAIGTWGIESAPKIQSLCQSGHAELKGA